MGLFSKRTKKKTYDRSNQKPVIKASICNGEQVAGFKDIRTGKFEEIMLIRQAEDLETFKTMYGIEGEITKEYWGASIQIDGYEWRSAMGNDTNVNIGNYGEYFVAGELERRGMSDAIEE